LTEAAEGLEVAGQFIATSKIQGGELIQAPEGLKVACVERRVQF